MGFKCAIVGLPNVGKSTLFNALTQTAAAQAENYPFCTIEPNVGEVAVPDERLLILSGIANSQNTIPARMNFVDVAGLVRGAAQGEGLGNQFLAHIRETDAICYVLRCFEDGDITHVEGRVDPVEDFQIVQTELMLADLESLERRRPALEKKIKSGDKEALQTVRLIDKALVALQQGLPARIIDIGEEDKAAFQHLHLLTAKPVLYIANVDEGSAQNGNELSARVGSLAKEEGAGIVIISAQIESELALLDTQERGEYLEEIGLPEAGLNRLIRAGYALLGLQTYFTVGPKETRAWTFQDGQNAQTCAGIIHTDFARGFIRAETISYDDYITYQGEMGAREAGKVRQEGKTYDVRDGDVLHFKFNV